MSKTTNYVGQRIKNFVVIEKTKQKKIRKDGRYFAIYKCQCDCGTIFSLNTSEFSYKVGCEDCAKEHHYKEAVKSRRSNPNNKPPRHTTLSKLSPETNGIKRGSYANNIVGWIKGTALKRGLEWKLDPVEVFYMIQEPCHYCNNEVSFPNTRNGLDRVDNNIGYIKDNVVPCCYPCNIAKHEMDIEEFRLFIIRINEHWASKK